MVAMAMWLAKASLCHITGGRPMSPRNVFTRPYLSPNMLLKIRATATGAMT
jgi:hypothetical protein